MALNQFAVDITFISIHLLLSNSVEQALSGSVTGLGTAVSMVGRYGLSQRFFLFPLIMFLKTKT